MDDEAPPLLYSRAFIIGLALGIFAGVALALVAVAMAGVAGSEERVEQQVLIPATATPLPVAAAEADEPPRAAQSLTVRLGPSRNYGIVGIINRGQLLEVIGRDSDAEWLAIQFPPGSTTTGWVELAGVTGLDDLTELAVLSTQPLPRPATQPLAGTGNRAPTTRDPEPTARPQALPDFVIAAVRLLPDGSVAVTVRNSGGDLLEGFIFVQLLKPSGESERVRAAQTRLPTGETVTIVSQNLRAEPGETIRATVNPFNETREATTANNSVEVRLAAP